MDRRHGKRWVDREGRGPHESGPRVPGRSVGALRDVDPAQADDAAFAGAPEGIVVLIPVFNDWRSLEMLMPRLDAALAARGIAADVLVVDDGSTIEPEDGAFDEARFAALRRVDVLRLRR